MKFRSARKTNNRQTTRPRRETRQRKPRASRKKKPNRGSAKNRLSSFLDGIILVLIVLLLVCAAGIELYGYIFSYSGQICVPAGKTERTVVRAAEHAPAGLTANEIPFDNGDTAKVLRTEGEKYLVRQLPVPLSLEGITIISRSDPEDILVYESPSREIQVKPGHQVSIDGRPCIVQETRKWSGLLQDSGGKPFISLATSADGRQWQERLNIASENWIKPAPNLAMYFNWADSKEAALQSTMRLPSIDSARWGIVDGGAVGWFDSFLPGTGATLKNGASVTLLEFDHDKPALLVDITKDNQPRHVWISPNQTAEPVRFEYPAGAENVVLLSAWRNHMAAVAAFHQGKSAGRTVLECGNEWQPQGFPWKVRIDQALEQAVPVSEEDSIHYELVMRDADDETRTMKLREADKADGKYPKFIRRSNQPVVKYAFTVNEPQKTARKINLGPDDSFTIGQWRFEQAQKGINPARMALLDAEWRPLRGYARYPLAVALALIVLLLLRRV